jgi:tetratricopeptide (TPR) repeat protein
MRALELREKVLEHLDTLMSMNNLAAVLGSQGKREAAEEMHRRTLKLREKVRGPEHSYTLTSMSNLALGAGKYKEAQEMYRQALELTEKALEHPDTLASMNHLALVLGDQGKYKAG